jgi:hypothetical protein
VGTVGGFGPFAGAGLAGREGTAVTGSLAEGLAEAGGLAEAAVGSAANCVTGRARAGVA